MSDIDLRVREKDVLPYINELRDILRNTDGENICESSAASLAGYLQSCTQYNEQQNTYKKLKDVLVNDTKNMEKLLQDFRSFDEHMKKNNQGTH